MLFGPVWALNILLSFWGFAHVLSKPSSTSGRNAFLALQMASWFDYAIWTGATFAVRSTINGLALTAAHLALTIAALYTTLYRLRDRAAALSISTLLVWLAYATPLAFLSMLWNRDEFYQIGPFTKRQTPTRSSEYVTWNVLNPQTTMLYIHLSGRELAAKLERGMAQIHAWRAAMLAEVLE